MYFKNGRYYNFQGMTSIAMLDLYALDNGYLETAIEH